MVLCYIQQEAYTHLILFSLFYYICTCTLDFCTCMFMYVLNACDFEIICIEHWLCEVCQLLSQSAFFVVIKNHLWTPHSRFEEGSRGLLPRTRGNWLLLGKKTDWGGHKCYRIHGSKERYDWFVSLNVRLKEEEWDKSDHKSERKRGRKKEREREKKR